MKNLIRKILNEEMSNREIDYLFDYLDKSGLQYTQKLESIGYNDNEIKEILTLFLPNKFKDIKPPYFRKLTDKGLKKNEIKLTLDTLFGVITDIIVQRIYDKDYNILYKESYNGWWERYEYDEEGNQIYSENSNGYWTKSKYNEYGITSWEDSVGEKTEYIYDENGVLIHTKFNY